MNLEQHRHPITCAVAVTDDNGLTILHDTRTDDMKILGGVDAVTLGGVGDMNTFDQLMHSMVEWTGPKVRTVLWCIVIEQMKTGSSIL